MSFIIGIVIVGMVIYFAYSGGKNEERTLPASISISEKYEYVIVNPDSIYIADNPILVDGVVYYHGPNKGRNEIAFEYYEYILETGTTTNSNQETYEYAKNEDTSIELFSNQERIIKNQFVLKNNGGTCIEVKDLQSSSNFERILCDEDYIEDIKIAGEYIILTSNSGHRYYHGESIVMKALIIKL